MCVGMCARCGGLGAGCQVSVRGVAPIREDLGDCAVLGGVCSGHRGKVPWAWGLVMCTRKRSVHRAWVNVHGVG